jgi:PKD repeat protein
VRVQKGLTRRIFFYALLVVISSILVSAVYAVVSSNAIIQSSWAATVTGISVYWDAACTDDVAAIDWSTLEVGSSENKMVYIKNTANAAATLFLDTDNWNPSAASQYITLAWDYGGQSISSGAVVEVVLTLTISPDISGITDFSFDIITVNTVNDIPVANAGPDQSVSDANGDGVETVTLDGSASSDIDNLVSYQWTEGSTVLGTTAIISPSFPVGIHTVTLTVTDSEGASAWDETTTIVLANQEPVADAGSGRSVYVGDVVSFDGSDSYDPDGAVVSYEWDFGDEEIDSGESVTHIYTSKGTYAVTLTLTDNGGLTSLNQITVTVEGISTEPTMHVEDITITKQVRNRKKAVFTRAAVTVTLLDSSGAPVEGATVHGSWSNLYNKDVSGVTNAYGTVSFKTRWLKDSGTLQFSVTDIVKTGWVYDPDVNMETWDSIESKRESTKITLLSYL